MGTKRYRLHSLYSCMLTTDSIQQPQLCGNQLKTYTLKSILHTTTTTIWKPNKNIHFEVCLSIKWVQNDTDCTVFVATVLC